MRVPGLHQEAASVQDHLLFVRCGPHVDIDDYDELQKGLVYACCPQVSSPRPTSSASDSLTSRPTSMSSGKYRWGS